ncbi:MAG: YerC/YecD family TrpR-related protein [Patescibacteria group bacterium]|nr:YerC/YecD family TrpR-related protein [Patescibacteria group bacterium]
MKSVRVKKRKARNKSQMLTMGGMGDYYIEKSEINDIAKVLSTANRSDLPHLIDSLFTKKELVDISRRLIIAKMLLNGTTYEDINKATKASKSTIRLVRQSMHENDGVLEDVLANTNINSKFLKHNGDSVYKYAKNRIKKGK